MARILVVEDDRNANRLLCAVLRKDGHEALSAADGREALGVLDGQHVDLIVSDLMMPNLNGMELVRQLREAGWDVPVLILTAREDQPFRGARRALRPRDRDALDLRDDAGGRAAFFRHADHHGNGDRRRHSDPGNQVDHHSEPAIESREDEVRPADRTISASTRINWPRYNRRSRCLV